MFPGDMCPGVNAALNCSDHRLSCVYTGVEIRIAIQSEYFLYGNDVLEGFDDLTTPANRSFIDTAHPLTAGLLTNFYVYVSPAAGLETTTDRRIQLQIWRLLSSASEEYRLVWQQLAFVNTSSTTGALLTVSIVICRIAIP